jgi:hypothetical protein
MRSPTLLDKMAALLESVAPRLIDAALVILLLRRLAPEDIGLLERTQAAVLPVMLFFLSPEQLLYKKFSTWKAEGPDACRARIGALRHFCWLKGLAGLALAFLFSIRAAGPNFALFCAFTWAFSRTLGPQIIAIDREYLRISGRVTNAFALVSIQKLLFFAGVVVVAFVWSASPLPGLAAVGAGSILFSGLAATAQSRRLDGRVTKKAPKERQPLFSTMRAVLKETLVPFSFWSHVNYVIGSSIESLDVLTLGVLGFPNRVLGIYGAAVRVANFGIAVPTALYTWFAMRLAQAPKGAPSRTSLATVARPTLYLVVVAVAQTTVLIAASHLIAQVLGSARWTEDERQTFARYLTPLVLGIGLYSTVFSLVAWLKLCVDVRALFARVFLPWLAVAGAIYFFVGVRGDAMNVARANIACYASYMFFVLLFVRKFKIDTRD